jgi:hypothetical protein
MYASDLLQLPRQNLKYIMKTIVFFVIFETLLLHNSC